MSDYKILVTGQLNDFRVAFNNMPQRTPLERFQKQQASQQFAVFDNELRLTNSELALRQKRLVGEAGKQKAEDDAKKACETFLQAKGRLWPDVDSLLKRYDELKGNDSVLNALRAYNAQAQAHLKNRPFGRLEQEGQTGDRLRADLFTGNGTTAKKGAQAQTSGHEEKERQASPLSDQRCDAGPMNRESGEGRMSLAAAHPSRGTGSSSCPVPLECFSIKFRG